MSHLLESSVRDAIRRSGKRHRADIVFAGPEEPRHHDGIRIVLHVADRGGSCFVSMSRRQMLDEGSEGVMHTFVAADGPLTKNDERKVDGFVAAGARAWHRETTVTPYLSSGIAPAWSYVMHRVTRMLVGHAANGRPLTFCPIEDDMVRPSRKREGSTGLHGGQAMRIPLSDFVGRHGRNVAEARADRVFVHDLEIGRRADNSPLAIFRDRPAPEMLVTGKQMPRTVLTAMRGMDLAEAIDHPAFGTHAGVPVLSATNDEKIGGVVLRIPVVLDPAGQAPPGVDTSWRLA